MLEQEITESILREHFNLCIESDAPKSLTISIEESSASFVMILFNQNNIVEIDRYIGTIGFDGNPVSISLADPEFKSKLLNQVQEALGCQRIK